MKDLSNVSKVLNHEDLYYLLTLVIDVEFKVELICSRQEQT